MDEGACRILLVEDSAGDALLLRRALERSGHPVRIAVAASLGAGIAALLQGFDAVLLDLTLPDSHGIHTVAKMHAAAGGLPIVVVTGLDGASLGAQCLEAGATGFLQKGTLDAAALLRALGDAIGWSC